MQVQISTVIITYNEEKNIRRCIESVLPVSDEVVVVDSFSKDKTKEIAESLGAKFVEHAFDGHIQQKNYAITQASNDYVLSLDADEALSAELQAEILKVKNNFTADGYYFNRLTNYAGKWIRHCGWYPDQKLRLWYAPKGKWTGRNPHDRFEMEKGAKLVHLKGDLLHYSIEDVAHHLRTIESFSSIAAEAMLEKRKKNAVFHMLLNPAFKFIRNYFLKGGFLDGKEGFLVCWYSAYATYLKYYKLLKLKRG